MTDEEMLKEIESAERYLKIFIYPIPKHVIFSKTTDMMRSFDSHFKSDYLFPEYLKYFYIKNDQIPLKDSRKHMIVNNPELANVFIIDHEWMFMARFYCDKALNYHMGAIIQNVIENYPYYNRSNGRDHFLMGVYDKGPLCDMMCSDRGNQDITYRIINTSFIGNYGMDRATFYDSPNATTMKRKYETVYNWETVLKYNVPCHRAGYDIVIPQLLHQDTVKLHRDFAITHIPYREFDSSFAGSDWGERQPVHKMAKSQEQDYISHHVENFVHLDGGSPDHSLKYRGYFMYHPCGYACWSQRLYEALAVYTIPIIVTDGGIQAFERFIDWRRFTVKMSLSTWYNDTLRTEFRTKIRNESDLFRDRLIDCWQSLQIPTSNLTKGNPTGYKNLGYYTFDGFVDRYQQQLYQDIRQSSTQWISEAEAEDHRNSICSKVLDTFIWKKTDIIERVLPWFDFIQAKYTKYNAFRLLTLEIWCHIKIYVEKISPTLCNHRADYTSREEYFY